MRTHDRSYFYKYVTADIAEKILESGKLQWSAPHLFNDPFDHQIAYRFPFTGEQAAERLFDVLVQIVFGADEHIFSEIKPLGIMARAMRSLNLQGEDKTRVIAELKQSAQETVCRLPVFQDALNSALKEFLAHARVLCVSEDYQNVVMWSHYADKHTGAVIRLNCIDAVDNNLLRAIPVKYIKEFPEFLALNDWVDGCCGLQKNDFEKMLRDLAYAKHADWQYEKEWRLNVPLMPYESEGDGRSFYSEPASIFGAIYLGVSYAAESAGQTPSARKSTISTHGNLSGWYG